MIFKILTFLRWLLFPKEDRREQNQQPTTAVIYEIDPRKFKNFNRSSNYSKKITAPGKTIVEFNDFLQRVFLPLLRSGQLIYPGIFEHYMLKDTIVGNYFLDGYSYIDEQAEVDRLLGLVYEIFTLYESMQPNKRSKNQNWSVLNDFHSDLVVLMEQLYQLGQQD